MARMCDLIDQMSGAGDSAGEDGNDAEEASGGDYGQFDFLDYNKPLDLQAAPADLVIDRSTVQQQAQSV
ncbi:hypothetical protein [Kitasatospora viridis]|nr:hypothetical protein [Kitasatospora viridis]